MLLAGYLENIQQFNIEISIKKVMKRYNRTKHKTTKFAPNEIFYNTSEEFYKIIYNNTFDYYEKNNKSNCLFQINEKCLMINNFVKLKNKTKEGYLFLMKNKVKRNKSFVKICVEIIDYINGGNYIIKIIGDYNYYNLLNDEKYAVPNKMLIKCDISVWNNYFKYINNQKNLLAPIENKKENGDIEISDSDIDSSSSVEEENLTNISEYNIKKRRKSF